MATDETLPLEESRMDFGALCRQGFFLVWGAIIISSCAFFIAKSLLFTHAVSVNLLLFCVTSGVAALMVIALILPRAKYLKVTDIELEAKTWCSAHKLPFQKIEVVRSIPVINVILIKGEGNIILVGREHYERETFLSLLVSKISHEKLSL
jgi:hypothetical protein